MMLTLILPVTSCASNNHKEEQNMKMKKVLVTFFSRTGENYAVGHIEKGNTHIIAEMIAKETGGDLFQIEPAIPYPEDYTSCTEIAQQEKARNARPDIIGDRAIDNYDVIFIGYPNWWGDLPMPVYSFIEKHDWQGKTIVPFCTHEGSGLGNTESRLKKVCKGASLLHGLAVRGTTAQNNQALAKQQVTTWIQNLNY